MNHIFDYFKNICYSKLSLFLIKKQTTLGEVKRMEACCQEITSGEWHRKRKQGRPKEGEERPEETTRSIAYCMCRCGKVWMPVPNHEPDSGGWVEITPNRQRED
jgi:hypothetical protein